MPCDFGSAGKVPARRPGLDLDQKSVALAAARADRRKAWSPPLPRRSSCTIVAKGDPRAGSADRVSERDGAAVHVHALGIDAEHLRRS